MFCTHGKRIRQRCELSSKETTITVVRAGPNAILHITHTDEKMTEKRLNKRSTTPGGGKGYPCGPV